MQYELAAVVVGVLLVMQCGLMAVFARGGRHAAKVKKAM